MPYNYWMCPGPPASTGTPTNHSISPAVHWVLRIGIYMCYLGHGSFGILTKEEWTPYFGVAAIGHDGALRLMPWVGLHDITLAAIGLASPRPILLLWMTIWALWTAALRPLVGQGMWEFWERAGNYGVPLAFLLLAGWPRSWREWIAPIRPGPVPAETRRAAGLTLRCTIALLLIGHAGFGVFQHKEGLAQMYAQSGLPAALGGVSLLSAIGWFELLLAAAILLKPVAPLLLFVCVYKIASELLYPLTGHPWWEFIERGGDYTAPVALLLLSHGKERAAAPARPAPAFGAAALLLGLLLAGACLPHDAWAQRRDSAARGAQKLTAADTARVDAHFTAPPDTALVRMLRAGGYVLAFRHGATNWNERDRDVVNYADRAGQRNLSATGRALMTNVGQAIAALGIPIGVVHASPMWRCRDTATLAFGRCDTTSALFVKSREYRRIRWNLLSVPPAKGVNNVVVTHQDALMPITTLARDQLKECETLVVEPLGPEKGFRVVAQLGPEDWLRLASAAGVEVKGLVPVPAASPPPTPDSAPAAPAASDSIHPPAGSMGEMK